jgi:mRNA interferase RelE/StbE
MYEVRFLDEADDDLGQLDRSVQQAVSRRIKWLVRNADQIKPRGLRKELSLLCKLRVGKYRVLYQIIHDEQVIIIHLSADNIGYEITARMNYIHFGAVTK